MEITPETTKLLMCKDGPCQICIAVAKVDEEINQAAAALQRLIARRCDLRSEQNRVHGSLMRLPIEIKTYIFELLLPSRDEWGQIGFRTGEAIMPSYLASVCRGWRDIVWSNPFFWSTMHIAIGQSALNLASDPSRRINLLNWIQRSRTLPLTLHINFGGRSLEWSMELLTQLLDVMKCSNRLQSLSLDIPYPLLQAFHPSNVQWHSLKRLRINSSPPTPAQVNQPLLLLNPTASPEKIDLHKVSFQALQISWNNLTSANVSNFDLEDITQLFQHASQMTDCHIFSPDDRASNRSMPPIIHRRLKTLTLRHTGWELGDLLLDSFTLPCLQEFHTNEIYLLPGLPAFVHRSSCPLARLTLSHEFPEALELFNDLQPLPGVAEVVLESLCEGSTVIKKLLLEGFFPGLRHLTLRLQPFLYLLNTGVIPLLVDRKRPRPDGANEGRLDKFLVVDHDKDEFDWIWLSDVAGQLKALKISPREDGFEIL